jgi:transposase
MKSTKWMRQGDIDDGAKSGTCASESVQLRESRRRIRLLEHENEVLRHCASSGPARLKARLIRYCTRCRIS